MNSSVPAPQSASVSNSNLPRVSFDPGAALDGCVRVDVTLPFGGPSFTLIDGEALEFAELLRAQHTVATRYAGEARNG